MDNDFDVLLAYGVDWKIGESEYVGKLMNIYQELMK